MVTLSFVALVGCGGAEIREESIPKGIENLPQVTPEAAHSTPAAEQSAGSSSDALPAESDLRIWTLPEGWREEPTTQQMRLATVVIDNDPAGPHEVALSAFPGDVGGVEANLARWRGQAGIAPGAADDPSSEVVRRFERDGWSGYFARFDGPDSTMLAGGIYSDEANRTWFVRLVTDRESADRLEDPLFDFLQSFGLGSDSSVPAATDGEADR